MNASHASVGGLPHRRQQLQTPHRTRRRAAAGADARAQLHRLTRGEWPECVAARIDRRAVRELLVHAVDHPLDRVRRAGREAGIFVAHQHVQLIVAALEHAANAERLGKIGAGIDLVERLG